jgi:hypothetical protein
MQKTGSTAIQSAFSGFDDGVTKYANLVYQNHSIPFYTAYSGFHQSYHIWTSLGLSFEAIEIKCSQARNSIEDLLKTNIDRNLIFSGEDISVMSHDAIFAIYEALKKHEYQADIIIYVRPPISYMNSNMQEEIKADVFHNTINSPCFRFRIEKFIEIFGKEHVIVREFNRKLLYENNIITDFAKLIGVNPPSEGGNNNISLSTAGLKVLFSINKIVKKLGGRAKYHQLLEKNDKLLTGNLSGSM